MNNKQKDLRYYERLKPRWLYIIIPLIWFIIDYKGSGIIIKLDKLLGIQEPIFGMVLPGLICILLIVAIFKDDLLPKILKQLKEPKTYLYSLIGAFIYIVLILLYAIIQSLLVSAPVSSANEQVLQDIVTKVNPIAYFMMVAIIGPILEELVFRYGLINIVDTRKKGLRWVPYAISIIVFALIHEMGVLTTPDLNHFLSFLGYIVISLSLVITYIISGRRLSSTILLHIAINTLSTISTFNSLS